MFAFSFTDTDNSHGSRGNKGDDLYCSLTVQLVHKHLDNDFEFCNGVD